MSDDIIPALPLWITRTKAQCDTAMPRLRKLHNHIARVPKRLSRGDTVRGYSITAGETVDFTVGWPATGDPNWRETVQCPVTHLNTRMRGSYHAYRTLRLDTRGDRIYMTEGATALFNYVASRHPGTIGSEYFVDVPFGQTNAAGIRSEDLTNLTFPDASFDVLMSFEVLEHVPDYRAALRECARVLAPGGVALLSAPFISADETLVRATVGADGTITHHEPPDYHGDPINAEGILCYYWFGWSLLDDLRAAGFADAYIAWYASREFAYLEPMQSIIVATR